MYSTKKLKIVSTLLVTILYTGNAYSAFIETSNSCPGGVGCEPTASADNYGYTFTIADTVVNNIYKATLTNDSLAFPDSGSEAPGARIDRFAFNMLADLGVDYSIQNFTPNTWSISDATGGIHFDYVGDPDSQANRLGPQASLMFEFNLTDDFLASLTGSVFNIWSLTDTDNGGGFGGGSDTGQVAVSFQTLQGTEGSDLLASNWGPETPDDPTPPTPPNDPTVPEPTSLMLLGIGLLGFFGASRRKAKAV